MAQEQQQGGQPPQQQGPNLMYANGDLDFLYPLEWCCQHCGKRERKMNACSACHVVHYCSKECQKTDWTSHKPLCKEAQSRSAQLNQFMLQRQAHGKSMIEEHNKKLVEKGQPPQERPMPLQVREALAHKSIYCLLKCLFFDVYPQDGSTPPEGPNRLPVDRIFGVHMNEVGTDVYRSWHGLYRPVLLNNYFDDLLNGEFAGTQEQYFDEWFMAEKNQDVILNLKKAMTTGRLSQFMESRLRSQAKANPEFPFPEAMFKRGFLNIQFEYQFLDAVCGLF
mmetsp:Transcript_22344/g.31572  ORF Transcript_22344/g.31572 Transcript_22344/m.31572 type:complete len:279 (+) Transcript_22344:30-866(+)